MRGHDDLFFFKPASSIVLDHLFPALANGDTKAEMMLLAWNNFLRSLLRFVVVRSYYDKGLGRISLPLKQITGIELGKSDQFSFFFGGRRKKKEDTRN